MGTTTLQIPMPTALRDRATKVATNQGFSSLQEYVRILLNQLAQGQMKVSFTTPVAKLSAKSAVRYAKILADIESGKEKTKSF